MPVHQAIDKAEALSIGLLRSIQQTGEAPRESLEELCALATASDQAVALAASRALFRNVIEPLGDSFDPELAAAYVRLFAGVVEYCRRQPEFSAFDGLLREFGLETERQLVDRAARIRRAPSLLPISHAVLKRVKRVLVPSRVTLGADVAVTSVILGRLKSIFPVTPITLLGSAKAGSLFASDPQIELVETAYPRGGTLYERLAAWVALCDSVAAQLEGLLPDEYLIVDPDSRLTQLGLLPLEADDSRYYFFESRSYSFSQEPRLGVLAGCWLRDLFGPAESITARKASLGFSLPDYQPEYPYLALPAEDMVRGEALKTNVGGPLAAVNLGVGGNADKRVEDPFEAEMLGALIKAGYTLVLDRGAGDEELERTGRLLATLQSQGKTVSDMPTAGSSAPSADVFVWEGSLNGFGGLVAASDLYCGYDSAGGHLAAALGVPVIDIFTDSTPQKFRQRWTPWGQAPVHVITARRSVPRGALREFRSALRDFRPAHGERAR